jgi:CRP-like cAMP-binding protein
MIHHVIYDEEDIDTFLELTRTVDTLESKIMKKLLSVQNKISLIANIDSDELKAIIYDLKFIKYNKKDFVVEQGDISKTIYFILSGECSVFVNSHKVGVLKARDTFGESAAIFNEKRNATVICSSEQATLLSFCIDEENMEFCAPALATLYKNLAHQINHKLEGVNKTLVQIT